MYTTLISESGLAAHLDDAGWAICDCRHDLADVDAGGRAYGVSHVPGARFVHLDADLSAPMTGRNGRHPLPEPDRLARRLGEMGIGNGSQVVAYDASGGYYAARMWWVLRWLGHDAVAVLDGGWDAWFKVGLPVKLSSLGGKVSGLGSHQGVGIRRHMLKEDLPSLSLPTRICFESPPGDAEPD